MLWNGASKVKRYTWVVPQVVEALQHSAKLQQRLTLQILTSQQLLYTQKMVETRNFFYYNRGYKINIHYFFLIQQSFVQCDMDKQLNKCLLFLIFFPVLSYCCLICKWHEKIIHLGHILYTVCFKHLHTQNRENVEEWTDTPTCQDFY